MRIGYSILTNKDVNAINVKKLKHDISARKVVISCYLNETSIGDAQRIIGLFFNLKLPYSVLEKNAKRTFCEVPAERSEDELFTFIKTKR